MQKNLSSKGGELDHLPTLVNLIWQLNDDVLSLQLRKKPTTKFGLSWNMKSQFHFLKNRWSHTDFTQLKNANNISAKWGRKKQFRVT